MSTPTPESPETAGQQPEAAQPDGSPNIDGAAGAKPTSPPTGAEQDEATLPPWAQTELKRAREEAAGRRIQLRELREEMAKLTDPTEAQAAIQLAHDRLAEAEKQATTASLEAARERLGRRYALPDSLVARIQGDTPEAMDADAKALAALLPPANEPLRPDPLQGGGQPANPTPADLFAGFIHDKLK